MSDSSYFDDDLDWTSHEILASFDRIELQHKLATTSRVTLEDLPMPSHSPSRSPRRALLHTSSNVFLDVSPAATQEPVSTEAAVEIREEPESLFARYRW